MAAAGEEAESSAAARERPRVPFARGGPVFVPFMVGPISTVPEFMSSTLREVQSLRDELGDPGDEFEDELCVDALKVLSEEELVERALQEAMEEDWDTGARVSPSEDMAVVPHDPEGVDGQKKRRKGKKRGRHFDREVRAHIFQGRYLTKAEKMAEIKVKQEEDRCGAMLHSFCGDSAMSRSSKTSAEKTDVAKSLSYNSAPWKHKASKSEEHIPIVYPEVILCVEIYDQRQSSVKSQEFLVLGSQLLTDLKDNIYCSTNKLMEVNNQRDHSGYFLIEDTFYNDMRHYSAVDYSKPILDWLNESSDEAAEKWDAISSGALRKRQKDLLRGLNISNVPEFKSAKMQSTNFSDLHFRLGAGYLYCHQGNCKHTFVIRDMRLIHPEDTQNQAEYPLMTFQMQKRFQKCSVCQIYLATKMTVDDKWAPNNPCYFCKQCYYLLHYREDDSLLYHHTVHDYLQE
ncbi:snRNA-activating protein complex subunit-like [Lolium rigidum]|uniref:snRNA-activating protein complex subunit-like n=1 Tax=Lolium rigidum TaxID=89674 RepID=UPI001F5DE523|nr:snRNA-activating protein complex subunit-like [Lolium rigidum]